MRVSEPVEDDSDTSAASENSAHEAGSSGASDFEQEQDADIPFEELVKLQQEGFFVPGAATKGSKPQAKRQSWTTARTFKRENKNRPVEQSSKRPVPRHRQVVETSKPASRDPRFESLSGKFSTDQFRKQYAFMYDETLPAEKQELKKQMQAAKDPVAKHGLQTKLTRVEQQIKEEQMRRQQQTALTLRKGEERSAVQKGKSPFFLKRSEAKQQELIAKYKQLKASGGLEKAMQKRRRKNATKDHRYVPQTRVQQ